MSAEENLASLGLTLPQVAAPLASYVPAVRTGNLIYVSGQLPTEDGQLKTRGKVGGEVSEDEGYALARTCALNGLAAARNLVGGLDRVTRVVRVTGYVNSAPGFTNQPIVINGASDLLGQVFGDAGKHSRVAVGVAELPLGAPVEVDLILEVSD